MVSLFAFRFWLDAVELLLQRSRYLLWNGCLAALVIGAMAVGWSAFGASWSTEEYAVLVALPMAWSGMFAAAAILGSISIHHRRAWAMVVLSCSVAIIAVAAAVLNPT